MVNPSDLMPSSAPPVNEQALRILEELDRQGTEPGEHQISNSLLIGLMILSEFALQEGIRQRAVFKALAYLLRKRLACETEQIEENVEVFEH